MYSPPNARPPTSPPYSRAEQPAAHAPWRGHERQQDSAVLHDQADLSVAKIDGQNHHQERGESCVDLQRQARSRGYRQPAEDRDGAQLQQDVGASWACAARWALAGRSERSGSALAISVTSAPASKPALSIPTNIRVALTLVTSNPV